MSVYVCAVCSSWCMFFHVVYLHVYEICIHASTPIWLGRRNDESKFPIWYFLIFKLLQAVIWLNWSSFGVILRGSLFNWSLSTIDSKSTTLTIFNAHISTAKSSKPVSSWSLAGYFLVKQCFEISNSLKLNRKILLEYRALTVLFQMIVTTVKEYQR